jgi:hypothetical protein
LPVSAVDVIKSAFDHMKQQLFKPFRLGQWTRLAAVTGIPDRYPRLNAILNPE